MPELVPLMEKALMRPIFNTFSSYMNAMTLYFLGPDYH